ncbi:MAG: hypothetical protein ACT4PI_04035 [Actinomycetota bacterium]
MTAVLLVGTGAVGVRAARQLVDTPGVERLLIAGRDRGRVQTITKVLGERAEPAAFTPGDVLLAGVTAVATALPPTVDAVVARSAVAAGVPVASAGDDEHAVTALLGLDADAREARVLVAIGSGLAPGLADVLARHAAGALDRVDEVHVARSGVAGPASRASLRRARRARPAEWRDGTWHRERRSAAELVWFPDPVGGRECEPVAAGTALLVAAFPDLQRATTRFDALPPASIAETLTRRRADDSWGAVRVEVWGWQGHARRPVVYGVIERTAVAAGTVLAVTAARLAGALPALPLRPGHEHGAQGLGALFEPPPFLAELARRGVKAAVFEGVAVA